MNYIYISPRITNTIRKHQLEWLRAPSMYGRRQADQGYWMEITRREKKERKTIKVTEEFILEDVKEVGINIR